jgi:methionyl-tRNA formyltransferase
MKVVFFGSSRYVIPVLEKLNNSFNLALVVTTEQGSQDAVPFFCKKEKVEYVSVKKSADLISHYQIINLNSDIGVVADFGLIIPAETLKMFPLGVVNIHPSLLPKYRGPSPAQAAILNQETKTGVTIIELDKYVDHGPIIAQQEMDIESNDTAKSLYEKLFKLGAQLLIDVINKYETKNINPKPQDHTQATFTKFLTKEKGYFNLSTLSVNNDSLEKMVRAYYPWPGTWTRLRLSSDGQAKVIKFLPENRIQVEGGREMAYKDFINGYPVADKVLLDYLRKSEND